MRSLQIFLAVAIAVTALFCLGGCTEEQIARAAAMSAEADHRLTQADEAVAIAQLALDNGRALAEQIGSLKAQQVIEQGQQALNAAIAAKDVAKVAADGAHLALDAAKQAHDAGGSTVDVGIAVVTTAFPALGALLLALRKMFANAGALRQIVAGVEKAKEGMPADQVAKLHTALSKEMDATSKKRVRLVKATAVAALLFLGIGLVPAAELGLGPAPVTSAAPSGSASGDLTGTYPAPTIGSGKVTSTAILDGTILNADINAAAAIAGSKVASIGRVLASSATAVPLTGSTNETTLATYAMPANTLAAGGRLQILTLWSMTNSTNSKIMQAKIGATGFWTRTVTAGTTFGEYRMCDVWARTTTSQITVNSALGTYGTSGAAATTGAEDLTTALNVTITGQLANSGETLTLEAYQILVFNP